MLSATVSYPPLPGHSATVSARGTAMRGTTGPDQRNAVPDRPTDQCHAARDRSSRQALWAWARILAGGAILAVLLWRVGSSAFLDGLRVLDGRTLAVALGIGLLTTAGSAWRWCLVARGLGIRLPFGSAVADYYRALFLNAALPGGILGDVHRAVRHGRDVGDVGRGVRAVVLERTAGQLVVVTVSLLVLATNPMVLRAGLDLVSAAPPAVVVVTPLAVALTVAVAIGARAATRPRRGAGAGAGAADGASDGAARWTRALRTAGSDVRRGLLTRGNWPWIALSSVLVLAGHLATFIVAARTAGASAPVGLLVPLLLLALLAMSLPLNIGGWGPREGVCAWAFGAAGLSAAQGLTVAVVYGLLAFVASLPGAAVLLTRWLATRRAGAALPGQPVPNRSDRA